jgi:ABC-type antimicrobial peptide transport system permease subunit
VLGQSLRFDGAAHEVIGVMPPSFHHVDGLAADVWTPEWPMPSPTDRRDPGLVSTAPVTLNLFGAAGLLLAVIGIYGVGAYGAAQRRQEIGVRSAVGAARRSIITLVVGEALRLALLGVVIGVSLHVVVTKSLGSLLHGLTAPNASTAFTTCLILLLVTASASFVPARRVARVDPSCLLRGE